MPHNEPAQALAKLREPFPPNQISKLPKETKAQAEARKNNREGINCNVCGGWHHPKAVHLDYVGHAALTDRLLDVDPSWTWEPLAFRDGLPAFDASGGLWIKLTVCGVTRLGYGHAASKPHMDPGAREKEVIGDALRNAAMRFGAALDLWHKGDLHADDDAAAEPARPQATSSELSLEPEEGWGAWTLGLIAHLGEVESEAAIEAVRTDTINKSRIHALRTIDPAQYQTIGKAFQDARARLAKPAQQKEAA